MATTAHLPIHTILDWLDRTYRTLYQVHDAQTKEQLTQTINDWCLLRCDFWKAYSIPSEAIKRLLNPALIWLVQNKYDTTARKETLQSAVQILIRAMQWVAIADPNLYCDPNKACKTWDRQEELLTLVWDQKDRLLTLLAELGQRWLGPNHLPWQTPPSFQTSYACSFDPVIVSGHTSPYPGRFSVDRLEWIRDLCNPPDQPQAYFEVLACSPTVRAYYSKKCCVLFRTIPQKPDEQPLWIVRDWDSCYGSALDHSELTDLFACYGEPPLVQFEKYASSIATTTPPPWMVPLSQESRANPKTQTNKAKKELSDWTKNELASFLQTRLTQEQTAKMSRKEVAEQLNQQLPDGKGNVHNNQTLGGGLKALGWRTRGKLKSNRSVQTIPCNGQVMVENAEAKNPSDPHANEQAKEKITDWIRSIVENHDESSVRKKWKAQSANAQTTTLETWYDVIQGCENETEKQIQTLLEQIMSQWADE